MNESTPGDCPFCQLSGERVVAANTQALSIADVAIPDRGIRNVIPGQGKYRKGEKPPFEQMLREVVDDLHRLGEEIHRLPNESRPNETKPPF